MTLASPYIGLRSCCRKPRALYRAAGGGEVTRIVFIPARSPGLPSGGAGQYRQRQLRLHLRDHVGGHVQARTAVGAAAGAHGQLADAAATVVHGFADLAVGDSIAEADVHGREPAGAMVPFQQE